MFSPLWVEHSVHAPTIEYWHMGMGLTLVRLNEPQSHEETKNTQLLC